MFQNNGFFRIALVIAALVICTQSAVSQYVDFGRNKVQYNDFDWHTLSTEHFKVYYYPQMKELAEIGAAYAEEFYKIHEQDFNYSLVDTTPIIFYATPTHFRETNTTPGLIPDGVGGFTEFIKGRVVIPFDGSLGNFKHVIGHELTHVFMMAKLGNILRMHKQTGDRMPPLWFTEGLAEAWSNEWDATADMVIKDAVLSGYMVGLSDWEQYYGTFFMYKMGQNAINYIAEKYGKEKVLLLMENFWMYDDFSSVMEKTIGKDYEAFDKDWLYHLKKKYFPELAVNDNPSAHTEPVFTHGFGHKPSYYNDGINEYVFLIGNVNGYTSVFRVNLTDHNKTEVILEGEKTEQLEEFHYFRTGMDISSKGILAFATKSGGTDVLHLYNIRLEKITADYRFDNIVHIGAPAFSKEGDKVVFSALDMGGKSDLYIFEIKNKKLTRLTNDYFDDRDPDISPDGKTIVFSSDRTAYGNKNRYNLFTFSLEDNSISYLTCGDEIDFSPRFSDDGKMIAFTSTLGGSQNIWCMELDTEPSQNGRGESINVKNSQIKKLTNFTTAAFDPKWVGDNKIIFSCYESGITVRMLDSVNSIIDTPKTARTVNYEKSKELWVAERFMGIPKKNELKYKKEYTLDIATSEISTDPVFGTSTGGILAMSDILGNDQYYFLVYNNSQTGQEFFKNINIAISHVSLGHRLNYAYGIFHLSGLRYSLGDEFTYYERRFGGYYALSYPLSFFQRIDASVALANSFRDITNEGTINRRALLLTNSLSYVKDNSIWGPTGPLDGNRFNVTLSYTTDIQFGNVSYYTFIFDYRRYLRLSNMVALATRFEYLKNEGREANRWAIGGSWDLRGWPRFGLRGKQAFVTSAELRFPLINILAVHLPIGLNLDFPYIRGAAFFDVGNAWDDTYGQTLGSIGLGARINVFNIIALRYDIGKRIENNFKNFQTGLFQEFFFGWDF
jgi:hypothetical protein